MFVNLMQKIKNLTFEKIKKHSIYRWRKALWRLGVLQSKLAWSFHPQAVISRRRLRSFKNKHQGKRCFIIGNGPSLKNTDLSLLKDEVTFGLNRIYLLFDEIGFETTYHVAVNKLVLEQTSEELSRLSIPSFVSWDSQDALKFRRNMMYLRPVHLSGPRFFKNIDDGIWEGATVTYVAMQIAFYMGFEKVILIGVDHSFETKGKPHTTVVSQGDDPNHFSPHYFGEGFRWQLPDLETSELAYRIADHVFTSSGRDIVDATVGGKLDIFTKVDYESLFT
jgi:hypothetical protein